MGPILPVDAGSVQGTSSLQPSLSTTSPSGGAAPAGLNAFRAVGTSQAVTNLQMAVTQLLQSAGGAAETDKLLRLLIVALILMSLLEQMEKDDGASGQSLAKLSNGGGDRSQFVGIYTSSTTISIQQSTTTVIMGSGFDSGGAAGDAAQDTGGRVDVSA